MLFPTKRIAEDCRDFIERRTALDGATVAARLAHLLVHPGGDEVQPRITNGQQSPVDGSGSVDLHIVLFPSTAFSFAKQFWQHSGLGISSRLAEHCLSILSSSDSVTQPPSPKCNRFGLKSSNRHYSVKSNLKTSPKQSAYIPAALAQQSQDELDSGHATYLEERYGRNLPLASALVAKRALRRRIAGVLVRDSADTAERAGDEDLQVGPSSRGANVSEDDVYLYPGGMAAIWSAHNLALSIRPQAKSVCFGFVLSCPVTEHVCSIVYSFPYTDTLKILEKWGPGCHFFGNGVDSDIDELETLLAEGAARDPSKPPVLALFTEFPSNPLLRSADLPRLRALADKYDFLIVVDETIGNLVNVQVLPYADIVVSSLTKIFSGDCNVMGGR
ncbi:hypothetical protein HGRIS_011377 [Hohenbuehelia grisea]|uniref:Cystathionine gamma-synthase n=1 Tax=Hohenbuehelia grisea TaxID=104357 RepID=A0ABR3JWM8_9AGAR